jgi:hypothetical protein
MKQAIEMTSCGMIYIPSFRKTSTCIQAVLRFCLGDLENTDGRDLSITPLRWAQVPCLMKTGSDIQKYLGRIHIQMHRQQDCSHKLINICNYDNYVNNGNETFLLLHRLV